VVVPLAKLNPEPPVEEVAVPKPNPAVEAAVVAGVEKLNPELAVVVVVAPSRGLLVADVVAGVAPELKKPAPVGAAVLDAAPNSPPPLGAGLGAAEVAVAPPKLKEKLLGVEEACCGVAAAVVAVEKLKPPPAAAAVVAGLLRLLPKENPPPPPPLDPVPKLNPDMILQKRVI